MPTITPARAASIRWGMCAHLGGVDHKDHDVVALCRAAGAVSVRTNVRPGNPRGIEQAKELLAAGITLHAPLPTPEDWRKPGALAVAARAYLDGMTRAGVTLTSVEFANEFNAHGEGWADAVRREMAGVAAVCAEAGVTFLGPSLLAYRTEQDAPMIAQDADGQPLHRHYPAGVAVHSYTADDDPETSRTLTRLATVRATFGGDVPAMLTETGYLSDPTCEGYTDPERQATLAPRLALAYLAPAPGQSSPTFAGLWWYELLDEPHDTRGPRERSRGFFTATGEPKPAASALAWLAEVLRDTGDAAATFTPTPLDIDVTGGEGITWRLLQKSGRVYRLAVWHTGTTTADVRVTLGRKLAGLQRFDQGDADGEPLRADKGGKTFTVAGVGQRVTVLRIRMPK